jgi:hypothetical protein
MVHKVILKFMREGYEGEMAEHDAALPKEFEHVDRDLCKASLTPTSLFGFDAGCLTCSGLATRKGLELLRAPPSRSANPSLSSRTMVKGLDPDTVMGEAANGFF